MTLTLLSSGHITLCETLYTLLLIPSVTRFISFNHNVDQKGSGCVCFAELATGNSNQCFPEVFHRCGNI